MSKESRRRQRATNQQPPAPGTSRPAGSSPTPSSSTSPRGTARAGRRERGRTTYRSQQAPFLERNRNLLVGIAVIAVVAIAGIGMFAAASQPVFACSNTWEPTPTPTPPEGSSPQPGYAQPDMGQTHVANGTPVTYTYCPPASGRHYNAAGAGPIPPRLYGPEDQVYPQGWIHNLEHGGMVVLYRGDGAGATPEVQAQLQSYVDDFPPSPVCGFEPGVGANTSPVVARFDQMAWPFAAIVWGRVLPLQEFDQAAILEFYSIFGERTNPEKFCEQPSASPSASPSDSTTPSGSPSASPSAAPSASSSATPSGSPSTEPSPSAS